MTIWLKPFFDPVFFAPTLGSMLMCLSSSLVGVLVFIRRRSLLGETLSHAAYPGVVLSVLFASFFFSYNEELIAVFILVGAAISSLLGLYAVDFLKRRLRIYDDAALTFVLASFLGFGILLASHLQQSHALWYRQIQLFLYGQVATMREGHVWLYGWLSAMTVFFVTAFYHSLLSLNFDKDFARTVGMRTKFMEELTFWLFVLAIVIGIRSVGVVLMSGMLIAPPIAAKAFTNKLSRLLWLSALFGLLSGYLGNVLSLYVASRSKLFLPTGPTIILIASFMSISALIFAPKEGLFFRTLRRLRFHNERLKENVLKIAWKNHNVTSVSQVKSFFYAPYPLLWIFFKKMAREGWLTRESQTLYRLTSDGERRARRIVRLHRLWEVYLFDYLGVSSEKVHPSACEMEHILTEEMERKLIDLIGDATLDPHRQPIPREDS